MNTFADLSGIHPDRFTSNGSVPPPAGSDADLVWNVLTTRREFLNRMMDPRRDVAKECGWPEDGAANPRFLYDLYRRDPIANRAVEVFPRACMKRVPEIEEDEDPDTVTDFEEAVDNLSSSLVPVKTWHKGNNGALLWDYVLRADIVSGISGYGIILLGLNDGQPLNEPINLSVLKRRKDDDKLKFMRVFPEYLSPITTWESDQTNARYGQPVTYTITFNDPTDNPTGIGVSTSTQQVHWSRVVHIPDNLVSSEVFGLGRLLPVLDPILDCRKVRGGGAEGAWRGVFPGISLETNPQLGGAVPVDQTKIKNMMEAYGNSSERYLTLIGMTAKTLPPTLADITPAVAVCIEAICIKYGIPVPVFKGYEIGEQASSNNDQDWNDNVEHRQHLHVTPRVIVALLDRLIMVSVLPEPESYEVKWPDLSKQTATEKATVLTARVTALQTYIAGNVASIYPPKEFLVGEMDMDPDDADVMLTKAADAQEASQAQAQAVADEQGHVPAPPDGYQQPPAPGEAGGPPLPPTGNANPEGINQYTVHGDPKMGSVTVKHADVHVGHVSQLGKNKWRATMASGKKVAEAAANHHHQGVRAIQDEHTKQFGPTGNAMILLDGEVDE